MAAIAAGYKAFMMTDVVGSTRLWERQPEAMERALHRHDEIAADCVAAHKGRIVKNRGEGDSLFVVFDEPLDALHAARDLQNALQSETWQDEIDLKVRIAIHTGESKTRDNDYYGPAINRCARLRSIANGGQVLLTEATVRQLPSDIDVEIRDLGSHRLKDLMRPEHVSELVLGHVVEHSLLSLDTQKHNLPIQLTSFIGREEDILRVRSMFQTARLVTLMGTGGTGKTRLALQVAAEASDQFVNGLWFVDLSTLRPGNRVLEFIARSLGLVDVADAETSKALYRALSLERTLLIIDNCEQIVDDAAAAVFELLKNCSTLVILTTSREALNLPGEVRVHVPTLSVPKPAASLEEVEQSEAVRLFADRAILRKPSFVLTEDNATPIADLCRLLDGIPLAVEQAASNIAFLAPAQMLTRFRASLRSLGSSDRTLPERHRTIHATMQWSYDMLTEVEREVFGRSAVFAGGWTLEAIEAVMQSAETAEAVQRLVDKSLFLVEDSDQGARFDMLQSIREFALEQGASLQPESRERHARHYTTTLGTDRTPIEALTADHHNMVLAIEWLFENDPAAAIEVVINLRSYFLVSGYYSVGQRFYGRALQITEDETQRATILNVLGAMHFRRNDLEEAREYFLASLDVWTRLGDEAKSAMVQHNTGLSLTAVGRHEEAREMFVASAKRHAALGEPAKEAACNLSLARVLLALGDFRASAKTSRDALKVIGESDPIRSATGYANLAVAELSVGDIRAAFHALCDSLDAVERCGDVAALAHALAILALVLYDNGDPQNAAMAAAYMRTLEIRHGVRTNELEESLLAARGLSRIEPLLLSDEIPNILSFASLCCKASLGEVTFPPHP